MQYAHDKLIYDPDVYTVYQEGLINKLSKDFHNNLQSILNGNFSAYYSLSHEGILDNTDEDINSLQYPLKYINHYNIRIYISANIDVDKERRILIDDILPKIKSFASIYGIDVMLVDRYSDIIDNTIQHMTWNDSKNEINRCRHLSSGLFFISLQSDKYGTRILPKYIPKDVYDERYESFPLIQCIRCVKKSKEKKQRIECKRCTKNDIQILADQWYTIDNNNIPPRYILKSLNDTNDNNYYDDVLPKLREAFQGIVFADDDYNDKVPSELDNIFYYIKNMMKQELKNDLSFSDEVESIIKRIDYLNPIENKLTIHEFLKPKVIKSLNFIITSDKVIMSSKLKKKVKTLIDTIERMLVEPDDEGNDVIINRSIHEYEAKIAMANDLDISRCQWISRIFSYPISNNAKKDKKDNMDFLLGGSSAPITKNSNDNVNTNKYKDYNDNDDASLKLRLDNLKAHMLSKFRYESNMIKVRVPVEAYINDDTYVNGKEYLSEWKDKMLLVLKKDLDYIILKKLKWYHNCFGLNISGDDMDEILHHCKLGHDKSHDFIGRDDLINEITDIIFNNVERISGLEPSEELTSAIDSDDNDVIRSMEPNTVDDNSSSLDCITLCLVGIPGVGKSALISKLATICHQNSNIPVIIRFCGTSNGSLNGLDLIKSISNQIRQVHHLPQISLSNVYDEAVFSFQVLLSQYSVILFIDSLDLLTNTNQEVSHFSFLRGTKLHRDSRIIISLTSVNSDLKVIDTLNDNSNATNNENNDTTAIANTESSVDESSNKVDDALDNDNATITATVPGTATKTNDTLENVKETDKEYCHLLLKLSDIKQIQVTTFNDYDAGTSDSIKILHALLDKKGRQLTESQWEYVMQQAAVEPIPLYLRLIVPVIERWDSYHETLTLTATVKDFVTDLFQKLEDLYGRELVRATLGYITFSLHGLTLNHLQDLLSLNDDVTDSFFKNTDVKKLQIPINLILRIKNNLEEHALINEKKEGKIYWSHRQIKKVASDRYSANTQEEKTYRTIMGIYFGDLVDPMIRKERSISSQPLIFGSIPVWFPATILNRSRLTEAVHQMLEGENFLIFKAYTEVCRPDVICGSIKSGEGFNLISYFLKLKTILQTCRAKLMFKYKYMMTDSSIDYNDMLLNVDHYLAWLQRDITTIMGDPSTQIITTITSNQPLVSKAREKVEKFIKSTSVSFFDIDSNSKSWIRGKSCGGKSSFDIPRMIIRGHASGIRCITCTKDGNKIAASSGLKYGSIDNNVRIFDMKTGDLIITLLGHTDAVNSIAFNIDGTRLVSGGNDKTLRIFDTNTGVEIITKALPNIITSVLFYQDGKHFMTACGDSIMIWVLETLYETIEIKIDIKEDLIKLMEGLADTICKEGQPFKAKVYHKAKDSIAAIEGPIYDITELEGKENIDANIMEKLIAYANGNIDIEVDNESIGESITTIGSSVIESVNGNNNEILNDDNVEVDETTKPSNYTIVEKFEINLVKTLIGHTNIISSLVYRENDDRILSSSHDNNIILWNVTGMLMTLKGHTDVVNSALFSDDGSLIVSGSNDRSIRVWSANNGTEILKLEGHTDSVLTVVFSSDNSFVFSGSADKSIRKWDAKNGKELTKWDGHTAAISSILLREDIGAIISGSFDCSVIVWELNSTSPKQLKSQRHVSSVTALTISPDGKHIVSGSRDTTIRIWSVDTGEALIVLEGHVDDVTVLTYNADGSRLASGSGGNDNSIRIWDPVVGDWLVVLKGHRDSVLSLLFSPDGARLLSTSKDNSMRLFDSETGDGLELIGHTDDITSFAFTPDSSRLASGSLDKTIRVWNSTTGEIVTVIEGSTSPILSLSFNLHGSQIVSGSGKGLDNSIRIWQAYTGIELKKLRGHAFDVTNVSFTNDGSRIVSISDEDKCIKIWDAVTGADLTAVAVKALSVSESYKFEKNYSSAYIARFDKNLYGSRIISISGEKTIAVYDSFLCSKILEFEGTSEVSLVLFHQDGERIISGCKDGNLSIWDITIRK